MKSLTEIQNRKQDGDYEIVAKALSQSAETVRKKILGVRTDKDQEVQRAFSILLQHREQSETIVIRQIKQALKVRAAGQRKVKTAA